MIDDDHYDDEAHARSTDPYTSHESARYVDVSFTNGLILNFLKARGLHGGTSEEISDELQLTRVNVSPRLRPLARKGLVIEYGWRRGKSTCKAIVWLYIGPR